MAAEEPTTTEAPEGSRKGQFGPRLVGLERDFSDLVERMESLERQLRSIQDELRGMQRAVDPQELEFLWENMRDMTEVVSALRKVNGFAPLAEFNGTRLRRRKAERMAEIEAAPR